MKATTLNHTSLVNPTTQRQLLAGMRVAARNSFAEGFGKATIVVGKHTIRITHSRRSSIVGGAYTFYAVLSPLANVMQVEEITDIVLLALRTSKKPALYLLG